MSFANRMRGIQERENLRENAGDMAGLTRMSPATRPQHEAGSWQSERLRQIASKNVLTDATTRALSTSRRLDQSDEQLAQSQANADRNFERQEEMDEFNKKLATANFNRGARNDRFNKQLKIYGLRRERQIREQQQAAAAEAAYNKRITGLYDKFTPESVQGYLTNEAYQKGRNTGVGRMISGFVPKGVLDAVDSALSKRSGLVKQKSATQLQIEQQQRAAQLKAEQGRRETIIDLYKNFDPDQVDALIESGQLDQFLGGPSTGMSRPTPQIPGFMSDAVGIARGALPSQVQSGINQIEQSAQNRRQGLGLTKPPKEGKAAKFENWSDEVMEYAAKGAGMEFSTPEEFDQYKGAMEMLKRRNPDVLSPEDAAHFLSKEYRAKKAAAEGVDGAAGTGTIDKDAQVQADYDRVKNELPPGTLAKQTAHSNPAIAKKAIDVLAKASRDHDYGYISQELIPPDKLPIDEFEKKIDNYLSPKERNQRARGEATHSPKDHLAALWGEAMGLGANNFGSKNALSYNDAFNMFKLQNRVNGRKVNERDFQQELISQGFEHPTAFKMYNWMRDLVNERIEDFRDSAERYNGTPLEKSRKKPQK